MERKLDSGKMEGPTCLYQPHPNEGVHSGSKAYQGREDWYELRP